MQAKTNQKIKKLKLVSLFLTSMIINIVLLMLHIISATEFIVYGDEILIDDSFESHLPYIHAKLSYAAVGIIFFTAIVSWFNCCFNFSKFYIFYMLFLSINVTGLYS